MNANEESSVFPEYKATGSEDNIVITHKGADSINDASVKKSDHVIVTAGT